MQGGPISGTSSATRCRSRSPTAYCSAYSDAGRLHHGRYRVSSAQEFIFNHLTARDGLASNFVYSLWQDPKGYLWIGTENGLQRYDGYQFFSPYQQSGADRAAKATR